MSSPSHRVWFVTGATSGFGRALTEAAVADGDVVVAAGRRPEQLDALVAAHPDQIEALRLDVTDSGAAALVAEVQARYGRIDVLVNNAGHGQVGAVEETTDTELRELFELHFFAAAALTRAVLPGMRARRSGAIVQMSSYGGQVTAPGFSAYSASKFALEGFSAALAAEVASSGIRMLIVEPGAFRTRFSGGAIVESRPIDAYADTVGPTRAMDKGIDGTQPGDAAKAASAILVALAANETPLRLPLGDDAVDAILEHLTLIETEVRQWESTHEARTSTRLQLHHSRAAEFRRVSPLGWWAFGTRGDCGGPAGGCVADVVWVGHRVVVSELPTKVTQPKDTTR